MTKLKWRRTWFSVHKWIGLILAIAILPVVPDSAGKVLDQIGAVERDHAAIDDDRWYDRVAASDFRITPPSPVFPRLELPAEA